MQPRLWKPCAVTSLLIVAIIPSGACGVQEEAKPFATYTDNVVTPSVPPLSATNITGGLGAPASMRSTVTITADVNPAMVGQTVRFSAEVGPLGPVSPGGTVDFTDKDTGMPLRDCTGMVCQDCTNISIQLSPSGVPTCHGSYSQAGSHTVVVSYSGDGTFAPSSGEYAETIAPAATTPTLTAAGKSKDIGQPITFTATVGIVAPGSGTPTGLFTFSKNGEVITDPGCTTAVCTTTFPQAGTYDIVATYSGDGNFLGSSGTYLETIEGCKVQGELIGANYLYVSSTSYMYLAAGSTSIKTSSAVVTLCSSPGVAPSSATLSGTIISGKPAALIGHSVTLQIYLPERGSFPYATLMDNTTHLSYSVMPPYDDYSLKITSGP